jgi:hypothetical protein
MNIYQIKQLTQETSPYFFTRDTLKFFGQTLSKFSVKKQADGRVKISQAMRCNGREVGQTVRYFNPINNQLEIN